MSEVRSPRIFGRPMWAWAARLTTTWEFDHGRQCLYLPWRCRVARALLWSLCRVLTGHRMAAGERGYGGGGMLDVICAYCYFPWQVPADEMPSADYLVRMFHSPTIPESGG